MSDASYTWRLRVNLYDLDARDEVSCAALFRYFEETAMQASARLGFPLAWYKARGQFWVIRTMRMERNCAAHYQDELEIHTWISSLTRLRADRNYVVRRTADGQPIARATANWVYLDGRTMQPTRIAPDIVARFSELEPPVFAPHAHRVPNVLDENYPSATLLRRASHYEADSAQHINNTVYVNWLEEAVRDALVESGYRVPLDPSLPAPWFHRHAIEYLSGTRPGEEVSITTQLTARGRSSGEWLQEIRRNRSGEVIARARTGTVWVNSENRAVAWPQPLPSENRVPVV